MRLGLRRPRGRKAEIGQRRDPAAIAARVAVAATDQVRTATAMVAWMWEPCCRGTGTGTMFGEDG